MTLQRLHRPFLWGLALASGLFALPGQAASFRRGDVNQDGRLEISDAIQVLGHLFLGSPRTLACADAADADDDGVVNISDGVQILGFLFLGSRPPHAPFTECGQDPTADALACGSFAGCAADDVVLQDHVRVVSESPEDSRDPVLLSLDAATTTFLDPPGGVELEAGQIAAGSIPRYLEAAKYGWAYMRKLDRLVSRTGNAKVFATSGARFKELFKKTGGPLSFTLASEEPSLVEAAGEAVSFEPRITCGTAGAGQLRRALISGGPLIDFNRDGEVLYERMDPADPQKRVVIGFHEAHVIFDAGISIDYDLDFPDLDYLGIKAGLLFDAALDLYVDGHWQGALDGAEKQLFHTQTTFVIMVGPVPVQFTLKAGVSAGLEGYLDGSVHGRLGAKTLYAAQAGFAYDHGDLRNISRLERQDPARIPGTPSFSMHGAGRLAVFLRTDLGLEAGLPLDILTAELVLQPKLYLAATLDGQLRDESPAFITECNHVFDCMHYSIDTGLGLALAMGIDGPFGWDIWDSTFDLIGGRSGVQAEVNVASGLLGCIPQHNPPCVFLSAKVATRTLFPTGSRYLEAEFDARDSWSAFGPLTFVWDVDNDGICDAQTETGFLAWDYLVTMSDFTCKLTVIDSLGLSNTAFYRYTVIR
jgi:hypothetical protein